ISPDEEAIGGRSCSALPGLCNQHFRIEAYSPAQWQWFWAPSTTTQSAFHAVVAQLAITPGRTDAVLASPQLLRRSLQLVVPARDSQLRTVLVDVGYDVVCLDVTKAQAGQAILQALELLYPGRSFRLDVSSSQTLRHGDVIYGFEDRFERFEIGPVAWPTVHTASFSIRCPGPEAAEDIIVSAVDFDLLHLKVSWAVLIEVLGISDRLPARFYQVVLLPLWRGHAVVLPPQVMLLLGAILSARQQDELPRKSQLPMSTHLPIALGDGDVDSSDESPVQLLTAVVGTPQILRDILSDYASRRGWRPLVGVQPQPDDRALHLIPAAAEDSLASVVFRNGDQLLPRCLAREMPAADYHSIRLDGRRGRLRLPYHTRRSAHSPLHFRDGECLHADTGPWGPPPPTPAVPSSAYVGASWTPLMLLLAGPRSGWRVPLLAIFALSRAMISDDSRTQATSAVIRVGQYPWRTPADRAAVSATSDGQDFRCILHCPWTGPQGVFQGRASLTVLQLHQRFDAALLADASLVPVWPNPNFYRLNFVPGIRSSSLVCVLVHHDQTVRAVVVPGRISYTDLASAMRFILDTDVNQVRLPPAVHVRRMHAPESLITLRDGDLLDVLAGRPNHLLSVRSASFMKDCVLWTRNFEVINTIAVRLWFPHLQDSLLTWLEPGSRWDAAELTFTGPFRDRYPGRWVPVPWLVAEQPLVSPLARLPVEAARVHLCPTGVPLLAHALDGGGLTLTALWLRYSPGGIVTTASCALLEGSTLTATQFRERLMTRCALLFG
ncbi:unnamed protein product, partial [Symbiodinium microadriaticum]